MATKRGVVTSVVLVGGILAALYPTVIVPVLDSNRRSPSTSRSSANGGLKRGSMWSEIEKRSN
jgi:hypothetical protein